MEEKISEIKIEIGNNKLNADILLNNTSNNMSLSTGIYELDKMLGGGFYFSDVNIISAQSGVGKSTFLLNFCERASLQKIPSLYFTLDLRKDMILIKFISKSSLNCSQKYTMSEIRENLPKLLYNVDFKELMNDTLQKISNIEVIDGSQNPLTISYAVSYIKEFCTKTEQKPIVVIDYIQQIGLGEYYSSELDELNKKIFSLRSVCRQTGCMLFIVSTLNRSSSYDKSHSLDSLCGSSEIGYNADTVIIMSESRYKTQYEADRVDFYVVKNRYGQIGKATADYNKAYNALPYLFSPKITMSEYPQIEPQGAKKAKNKYGSVLFDE